MQRYLVVAAIVLGAGMRVARADGSTFSNGQTIQFYRLLIHDDNNADLIQPNTVPNSLWAYFNYANCVCSYTELQKQNNPQGTVQIDPKYKEFEFGEQLLLQPQNATPLVTTPLEIWVGSNCTDTISRSMYCTQIAGAGAAQVSDIGATGDGIIAKIPVYNLLTPEPPTALGPMVCQHRVLTSTVWAMASTMGGGMYDFSVTQNVDNDTLPPWGPAGQTSVSLPTSFTANPAESAIELSWKPQPGDTTDIAYYQALCAHADGTPAFAQAVKSPQYITPFTKCGVPEYAPYTLVTSGKSTTSSSTRLAPAAADAGVDAPDAGVDAPPDAPADADTSGDDAAPATPDAAPEIQIPQAFAQQDPGYICGEADGATSTSLKIQGLQNDQAYIVELLAIDHYGNAAGVIFNQTITPHPVTDVWEDLHGNSKYQVQGGFCLFADTYGDDNPLTGALRRFRDDTLAGTGFGRALTSFYYAHVAGLGAVVQGHLALRIVAGVVLLPLVAFALLWHLVTLPGLVGLVLLGVAVRRRRKSLARAAAAAAALLCVLAPGRARAQTPYWENQMGTDTPSDDTPLGLEPVRWHVGVRVGPYTPQIDAQYQSQTMTTNTPYADMFGKSVSIVPMLDIDRVLWHKFGGDIGIGLSVGYLGKKAQAWADCSTTGGVNCMLGDPNRKRSPGDSNSFHLIPLTVSAVYRFTHLDDNYGVPIIPYLRAGLAYDVWWVQGPNSISNIGTNKALGATLGVVGSIGLSVRAERIDPTAARSMQESGILHAGFFAEYDLQAVDGFGNGKKLDVGDNTWFAGVEFEF